MISLVAELAIIFLLLFRWSFHLRILIPKLCNLRFEQVDACLLPHIQGVRFLLIDEESPNFALKPVIFILRFLELAIEVTLKGL